MKSDISRDTFAVRNHFSRVISQQGRVMLDADSNEQTAILLHYLRTLAYDLIGPYAAPLLAPGFRLARGTDEHLMISGGRYYVHGLLVENDTTCPYTGQPYAFLPADDPFAKAIADKKAARYWVYLDAWERHVTALEDDRIREKALGGPDTCTRAQVVWQVKAISLDVNAQQENSNKRRSWLQAKRNKLTQALATSKSTVQKAKIQVQISRIDQQLQLVERKLDSCDGPLQQLQPRSDATMAARVDPGAQIADACVTSPDSKYRGPENQLYRVEVHRGGIAGEATIKWSRDNASVATAWLGTAGNDLEVANARGFSEGNWVELSDDIAELRGIPGVLVRLSKVEGGTLSVDPDSYTGTDTLAWREAAKNPKVRRWDHFATEDTVLEDDGSILIIETPTGTPDAAANWMDLEDGIQIQFAEGGEYRSGDYWLIPARVETGNIEWPDPITDSSDSFAAQVPPQGVIHYYAPLGFVGWASEQLQIRSCYCEFEPLSSCFNRGSVAVGANLIRPTTAEVMFPAQPGGLPAPPPGGVPPLPTKKAAGRPKKVK